MYVNMCKMGCVDVFERVCGVYVCVSARETSVHEAQDTRMHAPIFLPSLSTPTCAGLSPIPKTPYLCNCTVPYPQPSANHSPVLFRATVRRPPWLTERVCTTVQSVGTMSDRCMRSLSVLIAYMRGYHTSTHLHYSAQHRTFSSMHTNTLHTRVLNYAYILTHNTQDPRSVNQYLAARTAQRRRPRSRRPRGRRRHGTLRRQAARGAPS